MKKYFYIIIILVCVGLIYIGVAMKKPLPAGQNQSADLAGNLSVNPVNATTATAIGENVVHFRPDTISSDSESAAAQDPERNFQITPDLQVRMYLVDAYRPGICFGGPKAVASSDMASLINANQQLTEFIRQKYNLKTDQETYNKLKQLSGVSLVETASSKFNYAFSDGQCQTVSDYTGVISIIGGNISAAVASQVSHQF